METEELCEILESLQISENEVVQGKLGESYYVDGKTGEKFILPTKRPDGTLRKKIKVKPGYTPPEEQERYVHKHKRDNDAAKPSNGVSTPVNPVKANSNGSKKPTTDQKPIKTKAKSPESKHHPKKDKLETKKKPVPKAKEGGSGEKLAVTQVVCNIENVDEKTIVVESNDSAKSQPVEQNPNVEVDSKDESEIKNPQKTQEREKSVLSSEEKKIFNA
ncbi:conserved hypothetical protein [Theileria equi strain WA]|uniref:WIBG Mago-binding domain-containing protein n=1 Tax=Theileria equi strain WA TaxID=1537102 RepID=L1LCY9_THEEQ|nr:conserved hypothetical protein [Theileria equi strain WA]EKX73206.1 conserved hypothetical protein [Theileria equi strain WA]|eukprot:XP_004832658.1 conserved hypothetical protein [Theileria equi strain WA]